MMSVFMLPENLETAIRMPNVNRIYIPNLTTEICFVSIGWRVFHGYQNSKIKSDNQQIVYIRHSIFEIHVICKRSTILSAWESFRTLFLPRTDISS